MMTIDLTVLAAILVAVLAVVKAVRMLKGLERPAR